MKLFCVFYFEIKKKCLFNLKFYSSFDDYFYQCKKRMIIICYGKKFLKSIGNGFEELFSKPFNSGLEKFNFLDSPNSSSSIYYKYIKKKFHTNEFISISIYKQRIKIVLKKNFLSIFCNQKNVFSSLAKKICLLTSEKQNLIFFFISNFFRGPGKLTFYILLIRLFFFNLSNKNIINLLFYIFIKKFIYFKTYDKKERKFMVNRKLNSLKIKNFISFYNYHKRCKLKSIKFLTRNLKFYSFQFYKKNFFCQNQDKKNYLTLKNSNITFISDLNNKKKKFSNIFFSFFSIFLQSDIKLLVIQNKFFYLINNIAKKLWCFFSEFFLVYLLKNLNLISCFFHIHLKNFNFRFPKSSDYILFRNIYLFLIKNRIFSLKNFLMLKHFHILENQKKSNFFLLRFCKKIKSLIGKIFFFQNFFFEKVQHFNVSRKIIKLFLSKNCQVGKDKNNKKIRIEFDLVFLAVNREFKKITCKKKMF